MVYFPKSFSALRKLYAMLVLKDQSCDDEWVEKNDSRDDRKESSAIGRTESMEQEKEQVYKLHEKVSQSIFQIFQNLELGPVVIILQIY